MASSPSNHAMSSASPPSSRRPSGKRESNDIYVDEDSRRPHKLQKSFPSEEWNLPGDTMVALRLMRDQFPKLEKVSVQPFVLRSQLYSSIKDRSVVDQELETLRQQQTVRLFKLNSGQDDFAVMLLDDYLSQLGYAKSWMETKHGKDSLVVFDDFRSYVITANFEVSISHAQLVMLLSKGGRVTDKHISLLINAGLLVRQLADETTYWFSIPNIGPVLKSLTQGRKELLQFLSRRRYKEILLSQLEKRGLRTSSLGVRFHVRDFLGSGKIQAINIPSGLLVRLEG